ncbi:kinase-like protein, partial [Lepidopterella palustris CBS 459.81]
PASRKFMMSSLWEELDQAKRTCPLTDKEYIPLNVLHEKITWQTVVPMLPDTIARRWFPCWDYNLSEKIQGARKIIAILVLINQERAIEDLCLGNLTDGDLPISRNGVDLQSRHGKKVSTLFTALTPGAVDSFLKTQWMFLEPILELVSAAAINIKLDSRSALESAFSSCVEELTNYVYKGVLETGCPPGLDGRVSSHVCVAVKRFERRRSKDRGAFDPFNREKENLEKIQSKGIKSDHLIRHLAICDQIRCIIFPWADGGDLGDFWQGKLATAPGDFLWSLRQITGLAHALENLHHVNIRHGDLKPANILYFTNNGDGILKIADFGISRAHRDATFFRKEKTITSASTKAYEGPEVNNKTKISRRYDCWSMGCIILEFVVWLLYGYDALDSFYVARKPENHSYYLNKSGSVPETARLSEKAEVNPKVYSAMKFLLADQRCGGTALEELVTLVRENLLQIEWEDRLCAACLHENLRMILTHAENEPSYLVNVVDPPDIPEIFSQPTSDPALNSTMQSTSQ